MDKVVLQALMQFLKETLPENLANINYAPEEVCGNKKGFYSALKKSLKQISDFDSRKALTLFSLTWAAEYYCP